MVLTKFVCLTTRMHHVHYNFLYISNLFAKAPGFDIGKKLSYLLSNYEALN